MRKNTFKILLLILSAPGSTQLFSSEVVLNDWEINIDGVWKNTKPVYWEAAESKGGVGIEHDGFARYRTTFKFQKSMENGSLAFFTDCIDDSDAAYINGKFIGETGKVPPFYSSNPIKDMRSGVRESRLYPIPQNFLNNSSGQTNTLEIIVYDLAGTGGFCYLQNPVIGDFAELQKKYIKNRLINDIPRGIIVSLLLIVALICVSTVFFSYKPFISKNIGPGNIIVTFLKSSIGTTGSNHRINSKQVLSESPEKVIKEKIFRLLSLSIASIMVAVFLVSEIPSKYNIIESESFWYQFPPLAFYIAIYFSQTVFHCETFGNDRDFRNLKTHKPLSMVLFILSHPYWYIPMMVFLAFSKPEYTWNFFVTLGLGYALVVHLALGVSVTISMARHLLMRFHLKKISRSLQIIKNQMYLRFLSLMFMATGIFLFYKHGSFFANSVLIMGSFYNLTLMISTYFFVRYDISLPLTGALIQKDLSDKFDNDLKSAYMLTKTEILICREIRMGMQRKSLLTLLGVSEGALKNHLKSIYAKTIDKDNPETFKNRDKLQRLTIFLIKLG